MKYMKIKPVINRILVFIPLYGFIHILFHDINWLGNFWDDILIAYQSICTLAAFWMIVWLAVG